MPKALAAAWGDEKNAKTTEQEQAKDEDHLDKLTLDDEDEEDK